MLADVFIAVFSITKLDELRRTFFLLQTVPCNIAFDSIEQRETSSVRRRERERERAPGVRDIARFTAEQAFNASPRSRYVVPLDINYTLIENVPERSRY